MQIAIVHYHLNRGGVTQVIVNQLRSLAETRGEQDSVRVVIYYGGRKQEWPEATIADLAGVEVELCVVEGLEYQTGKGEKAGELAGELSAAFARHGQTVDQTVVHIHNHCLGKNMSLPGAVASLARDGFGILLQIHDFAEDFRPENYRELVAALAPDDPQRLPERMYWQGDAIHYAMLTARDLSILSQAGVPPGRLHSLPNPVSDFAQLPDRVDARTRLKAVFDVGLEEPFVIYPVRCIRRKNVGELLLWAAMAGESACFAITLPPLNPTERPRYEAWKRLAGELDLPLLFDVGGAGGLSFGENLSAANAAITTSVAEGFGMVFLETWLAGLPLIGRNLPEITEDFAKAGLQLRDLAESIFFPVDWVGEEAFASELAETYGHVIRSYGGSLPDSQRNSPSGQVVVPEWPT